MIKWKMSINPKKIVFTLCQYKKLYIRNVAFIYIYMDLDFTNFLVKLTIIPK